MSRIDAASAGKLSYTKEGTNPTCDERLAWFLALHQARPRV
jgi:hypothetical protein